MSAEEKVYMDSDGLEHLLDKFAKDNPVKASPVIITGEYLVGSPGPSIELSDGSIATVQAISNDTSVITVSVSDTTINTTVVGAGTTNIVITITAEGYFNTKNIVIPVDVTAKNLVSFSNGTDAEIATMIALADAGEIDLYSDAGWRVGDERTVSLSDISSSGTYDDVTWSVGEAHLAQTATLVLMDLGSNQTFDLVTPVKNLDGTNRTKPSFIVGLKDCLDNEGHMNSSDTNSGSWEGSARRKWCNGGFRKAFPEAIRGIFKKFTTKTAESYNGSTIKISKDYFALFAEKEIFGSNTYGNTTEASSLTQIEYYKASANRIKKRSGSANYWWERSPLSGNTLNFCIVNGNGSAYTVGASLAFGLAPFGCI